MIKYIRVICKSILSLLFLFLISSCINAYKSISGFTQGTTYSIVYESGKNLNYTEFKKSIEGILHDFDMSLSTYEDSSIISRMNRNEDVIADSFFVDVFNKSKLISEMTNGAFDITVAPLVNAWGFGPDSRKSFDESKRDSLMRLVGMDKISLVNGRLIKDYPDICLNVNAIAQGYSVDIICSYLDRLGVDNYLVEIGGEVRTKGRRNIKKWRVGIDRPEDYNIFPGQMLQAIIKPENKAVATSGNYRDFYVENGVKYSHTIDPRTGYPAKNILLSATIVTDECVMADGIATACMVMGKEEAVKFINNNSSYSAYFVYSDENGEFKTWMSENLVGCIEEKSNN